MISLPIVASRKHRRRKKRSAAKKTAKVKSEGLKMYLEELVGEEWVRTYYEPDDHAHRMIELFTSNTSFRCGAGKEDSSQSHSEDEDEIDDVTDDEKQDDEGTRPDIDMMLIDLDKKLCNLGEDCNEEELFAWMVPSEHPGFLHLVDPKTQAFISTDQFRSLDNVDDARAIAILCFSKLNSDESFPEITGITNQGPAVTLEFDTSNPKVRFTDSMDVVRSLYCPKWPTEARRWDDKVYQWPDPKLAQKIINDGCHIVAVPHPLCRDARYEFRYSFSHAELLLTKSVIEGLPKATHVYAQLLAYMVVKMIIKFSIKKASEQIKSYYAKTTFYWYLESEDSADLDAPLWTICSKIFRMLQRFFKERNVPNYCIPANNMIRHVEECECQLIVGAIQRVLDDPVGVILQIHRDVAILGYEINAMFNTDMIQVLQDLGFKSEPPPQFSILNSVFGGLHDIIANSQNMTTTAKATVSKCRSAVEKLRLFLRGALGVAVCFVRIEPKIVALRVLLYTFRVFKECDGICSACWTDTSLVDLMFWLMLHGVRSAPALSQDLQDNMMSLLKLICCTGLEDVKHILIPNVIDLQKLLSDPICEAQCYRWCALICFMMELKKSEEKRSTKERTVPGECTPGEGKSLSLEGNVSKELAPGEGKSLSLEENVTKEPAAGKGKSLSLEENVNKESAAREGKRLALEENVTKESAAGKGKGLSLEENVTKEPAPEKGKSLSLEGNVTKESASGEGKSLSLEAKVSKESAEQESPNLTSSNSEPSIQTDARGKDPGETSSELNMGTDSETNEKSDVVSMKTSLEGSDSIAGQQGLTVSSNPVMQHSSQTSTMQLGKDVRSDSLTQGTSQTSAQEESPSTQTVSQTSTEGAQGSSNKNEQDEAQVDRFTFKGQTYVKTHDDTYKIIDPTEKQIIPSDFVNSDTMFQQACRIPNTSNLFYTVCNLEYALYLLRKDETARARDVVSSISLEDIEHYNAHELDHQSSWTCLTEVLEVPENQSIRELKLRLSSLVHDIHGVEVKLKPFCAIVH